MMPGVVEACFSVNIYTALRLFGMTESLGTVVMSPDDESLGRICNQNPRARADELRSLGVSTGGDFVEKCSQFNREIRGASRVRIWSSGVPYEVMGTLYVASIVRSDVPLTLIQIHDEDLFMPFGDLNGRAMSLALERGRHIDVSNAKGEWSRLVAENESLRIVRDAVPTSCGVDSFDDVVRLVSEKYRGECREFIGSMTSDHCSDATGGPVNPDFFIWRMERLHL